MKELSKSARGRPKTLDRDQVLNTAMLQYWRKGSAEVSVNDIAKLTQSSKPSIYRAFGSDDGLKAEALRAYRSVAIDPFLERLDSKVALGETLHSLIEFMLQDRDALEIPRGCLFVAMRAQRHSLGIQTLKVLDQTRSDFLESFSIWIDASKMASEFRQDVPTRIAAHQFDALHSGAMRMQKEDVPTQEIKDFLNYGFASISAHRLI